VQIFADEGTLIVSGERRRPRCEGRVYQQMEIDYGRFTRQVALSAEIDVEGAKATYKRGVLSIVLPVAKKPASADRIEIPVRIGR
jgi:HSP20 family protein